MIEAYREFLPVTGRTPVVTLNEGNTPLVHAPKLSAIVSADVFLKLEGTNPTGSFKDRGMTMAISKAAEEGSKAVICASTGNTSASAAAYAARAGMSSAVLIPAGKIALGKLAQALIHGSKVLAIKGNFDSALEIAKRVAGGYPVTLVNSVNPYRIEGQKTGAYEVCDSLGDAPDFHCIPVGNAGNISAYWKGYLEYGEAGKAKRRPKMYGFQATGAAPLVIGEPVANPETVATAIRIGNPASWKTAVEAARSSQGGFWAVTDEEILSAYRLLADTEGVFCEPASAAAVAGLLLRAERGFIEKGSTVVCILTGSGLKDPDRAIAESARVTTLDPDMDAVVESLGL